MIRFLNLKGQIIEGENTCAFFDTVREVIINLGNESVFNSIKDIEYAFSMQKEYQDIDRFINLIPECFFNKNQN